MKGKDLNVQIIEKSQEEVAKEAIENIQKEIRRRKKQVEIAEKKLEEILEKEIENISIEDGEFWNWD